MPKIWTKSGGPAKEGKFLVVRRDGSVPHWPHFVLGARDPAAVAALMAYATAAEKLCYDADYVQSVRALVTDFCGYRYEHGEGDPPAAPHRKDDQAVVRAMRGEDVCICVRCDSGNARKEPANG